MASSKAPLSPEESFISMRELDPSPVDDSPVNISQSEYFPRSSKSDSPPRSTSSSLGLRDHSATWWLTRIQRYSSYTLTAFLTAHITNTSIIPLLTQSVDASDTYLLLTRPYYQSPLFEPLIVLIPLAAHIVSGVALRLYRRAQNVKWYGAESRAERQKIPWPSISGTSMLGYALWPLLAAHVLVNRVVPLKVEGGSSGVGLSYVAHGFARHPAVAFTAYVGLVGVGVWHFTWGWAKWLGYSPEMARGVTAAEKGLGRKRRWYGINGAAAVLAGLWMAGGLGVIGRAGSAVGWKAKNFDNMYRHVPLVGQWLAT